MNDNITNHTKCDVFGNIIILMICQSEYKICNMIEQVVPELQYVRQ